MKILTDYRKVKTSDHLVPSDNVTNSNGPGVIGTLTRRQPTDNCLSSMNSKVFTTTYWLVRPDKTHRAFAIKWRKKCVDTGEIINHGTFKDERTKILNKVLLEGVKTVSSVEKEFLLVIKGLQDRELQLRGRLPIEGENRIVVDRYWAIKYGTKRNKDLTTAKNETLRAVRAVGEVPLLSADANEIQEAVERHCNGDSNKQRRIIGRLKSVLKVNGRHETAASLSKDSEELYERNYLTFRDLPALINYIQKCGVEKIAGVSSETFVALIQFLFWSGLRIGEAVATEERYFNTTSRSLDVNWQIDGKGTKRMSTGPSARRSRE